MAVCFAEMAVIGQKAVIAAYAEMAQGRQWILGIVAGLEEALQAVAAVALGSCVVDARSAQKHSQEEAQVQVLIHRGPPFLAS